MSVERRSSLRVACGNLYSSYKSPASSKESISNFATIKNISREGILLLVNQFIPLSNKLILYLDLPDHQVVRVMVASVWISEMPNLGKYEIGAKFVDISQEARLLIRDLITRQNLKR